ncbi:hypothetical protein KP509_04G055700 [Ceratopteris richardii]|uniref:Secreted protein n=1 Tax=Ceratopteris richardii TaxID=49495 RepID=A0A8T2UX63_CERRI|nr:hypothetical protein KP509_04G055700 [Ceratopteris richardii]
MRQLVIVSIIVAISRTARGGSVRLLAGEPHRIQIAPLLSSSSGSLLSGQGHSSLTSILCELVLISPFE